MLERLGVPDVAHTPQPERAGQIREILNTFTQQENPILDKRGKSVALVYVLYNQGFPPRAISTLPDLQDKVYVYGENILQEAIKQYVNRVTKGNSSAKGIDGLLNSASSGYFEHEIQTYRSGLMFGIQQETNINEATIKRVYYLRSLGRKTTLLSALGLDRYNLIKKFPSEI